MLFLCDSFGCFDSISLDICSKIYLVKGPKHEQTEGDVMSAVSPFKKFFLWVVVPLFLTGCLAIYGGKDPVSPEGQLVDYLYVFEGNKNNRTAAVFRKPASAAGTSAMTSAKLPAVVVLHDGGGWSTGRTRQYADFFTARGYATLEPRLYVDAKVQRTFIKDLASLYGALDYLVDQPDIDRDHIYVMGMSAGAMLAILAKAQMANEMFNQSDSTFRAAASLYPVCWYFDDTIRGDSPALFSEFSAADLQRWQRMPIRLFIPEFDDYDDRDVKVCDRFIAKIQDKSARSTFSVMLYPNATHGWDHGRTYSFQTGAGCKGRGCVNTNRSNPEITKQGYEDILDFFNQHR